MKLNIDTILLSDSLYSNFPNYPDNILYSGGYVFMYVCVLGGEIQDPNKYHMLVDMFL